MSPKPTAAGLSGKFFPGPTMGQLVGHFPRPRIWRARGGIGPHRSLNSGAVHGVPGARPMPGRQCS